MNTCRICRRRDDHPRFDTREMMFGFRDSFTYFECTECGCVQIERIPDDLGKYYPNRYYSFQKSTRIAAFLKKQRARHAFHRTGLTGALMSWCLGPQPAIESIRRLSPRLDAAILDVGSGGGELLGFLDAIGFNDLTGADPFLERDETTPSGIKLLKRDLAQIDRQFDVLMMHHVFEHTTEPSRVFGDIKRAMRPGGVAIVRVPVADSWAWKTYGVNWVSLDPPRHIFVPTVRSMTILSNEHGLRSGPVVHDGNEFQFWGSEQVRAWDSARGSAIVDASPQSMEARAAEPNDAQPTAHVRPSSMPLDKATPRASIFITTDCRPNQMQDLSADRRRPEPAGPVGDAGTLAENTVLTVISQGLPLVVGLLLTPFILRRLGKDGFGLLSLGWTVLTLSLVFNLGLGRATTKYAAEHLAAGRIGRLPSLFWLSVLMNLVFGLAGTALVGGGSMALVALQVLVIPGPLVRDAAWMFLALSFALPFIFVTTTMRGMLEAGQHFRGMSMARLIFNSTVFGLPAVALMFSSQLLVIGLVLTASRITETVVYTWLCLRQYPFLWPWRVSDSEMRPLLVYGGWLTVTNLLLPLILNIDRFIIGSLVSVQAVAFYSVPADLVTRLTILPASIIVPLFPAFAALNESANHARLTHIYVRSMKHVAIVMGMVAASVIVMAEPMLQLWVGGEFARESGRVMQIVAVSMLVNSIGLLPSTVLQAVGRPDLTAKAHLFETPIAVAAIWYLTVRFGIAGTAAGWGLRVLLDTVILAGATARLGLLTRRALRASHAWTVAALVAVLIASAWGIAQIDGLAPRTAAFGALVAAWGAAVMLLTLDPLEMRSLLNLRVLFTSRLKASAVAKSYVAK